MGSESARMYGLSEIQPFRDLIHSLEGYNIVKGWGRDLKGRQPTQKATHPNKKRARKQFGQTLSACFLFFLKGETRGDSLHKLSQN